MLRKLGTALAAIMILGTMPAIAAPVVGQAAPEIEAVDINGEAFKLSDHKGKIVVLEWTNHKCPFVVKHYGSNNMQKIQKETRAKGVEWVSIVSSAKGKQGNVTAEEAKAVIADVGADVTTQILDPNGTIGKTYSARTTPHMFVIDTEGKLAYAGAIDSESSPHPKTIETADNYVVAAVDDLLAGRAVQTPQTSPYGCSVKY